MQLSEFSQNKNNLLNHITRLIKKFNTLTANIDLQNLSKGKWKCTVVRHIVKYANNYCVTKIKSLSKLRYIFKNKQELMKEKYMCKLSRSAASEIFKQRARMFHFKKFQKYLSTRYSMPTMWKRTRCGKTFIWKVRKTKEVMLKIYYTAIWRSI